MREKIPFLSLALFVLLSVALPGKVLGDASTQLEQAEKLANDGNYEQAEAVYKQVIEGNPGTEYAFRAQKDLAILYINFLPPLLTPEGRTYWCSRDTLVSKKP